VNDRRAADRTTCHQRTPDPRAAAHPPLSVPTRASVPAVEPAAALGVIEREAAAFAVLLGSADLAAPVLHCPGWTLADLARHLGGIHRWARHAVLVGPSDEPLGPSDAADIEPWFREGAALLVETLGSMDPDRACWTFAEPHSVRFWLRRQAHETTLHHWDAARSLGIPHAIDEEVAVDGIDEVVTMFVPRQVRLGRLAPQADVVELVCNSGASARLSAGRDGGAAAATVTGPAEVLLRLLWKRATLADRDLEVSGDLAAAARLLAQPLTP
jgi:uncharacterized protein (TIGR03083 family)